jgi:hypothetical protein
LTYRDPFLTGFIDVLANKRKNKEDSPHRAKDGNVRRWLERSEGSEPTERKVTGRIPFFFVIITSITKKNETGRSFLFFGQGMKTVQPIENERKSNQPMND